MQTNRHWLTIIFSISLSMISFKSFGSCNIPILINPSQSEISNGQPRIEWSRVEDASYYQVWIESRVPEGRLLETEEARTDVPFFIPHHPLTNYKATVKLKVTAVCRDETQSELTARFRIDSGLACNLETPPTIEKIGEQENLVWNKPINAEAFEVSIYSEDSKLFKSIETEKPLLDLNQITAGEWVIAVRPLCQGIRGKNSMVMFNAP